jgi:hypothetical protein
VASGIENLHSVRENHQSIHAGRFRTGALPYFGYFAELETGIKAAVR